MRIKEVTMNFKDYQKDIEEAKSEAKKDMHNSILKDIITFGQLKSGERMGRVESMVELQNIRNRHALIFDAIQEAFS